MLTFDSNQEQPQNRTPDRTKWNESFYRRSMEVPDELLIGAIDSHVHAGPVLNSNPGHLDPIQVAQEAAAAGMRSIVYYDVFGWASGMAWVVNRHVPGIHTYGGYLMNSCHAGMNPRSVKPHCIWKRAAASSASVHIVHAIPLSVSPH